MLMSLGRRLAWAATVLFETKRLWVPGLPLISASFSLASTTIGVAARLLREGRDLVDLEPRDLETLVADLLDAEGWSVKLTPLTNDGGVDVFATREDQSIGPILTIWQAKKYALHRKVEIRTIRELITVREEKQASKAFVVTTSTLTGGALKRIEQERFKLGAIEGPDLRLWVRRVIGAELSR